MGGTNDPPERNDDQDDDLKAGEEVSKRRNKEPHGLQRENLQTARYKQNSQPKILDLPRGSQDRQDQKALRYIMTPPRSNGRGFESLGLVLALWRGFIGSIPKIIGLGVWFGVSL
jgi:hypothetical protein